MKDIIKIIYLTIFFTVVIFFINYSFFWNSNNIIENNIAEEKFIETEINHELIKKEIPNKNLNLINFLKEKNNKKFNFFYYPSDFKNEITILEKNLINILEKNIFSNKINLLQISIIKEKKDRRWKMKNKEIDLYWANSNNINEYLSVFIHEFWHYIDLYFLEKKVFLDLSNKFYEISWDTTKIKKQNQTEKDFVSWYAMTNKYEDFSESFVYYILHNKDFLEKTKNNKILKEKYDFFANYIFTSKEFFYTKFNDEEIKEYYRDITKINFDKNKLFSYLKTLEK